MTFLNVSMKCTSYALYSRQPEVVININNANEIATSFVENVAPTSICRKPSFCSLISASSTL